MKTNSKRFQNVFHADSTLTCRNRCYNARSQIPHHCFFFNTVKDQALAAGLGFQHPSGFFTSFVKACCHFSHTCNEPSCVSSIMFLSWTQFSLYHCAVVLRAIKTNVMSILSLLKRCRAPHYFPPPWKGKACSPLCSQLKTLCNTSNYIIEL